MPFNLDHQYKLYLERRGILLETMSYNQRKEHKRAFMGGCSQLLLLLKNDLIKMPQEVGANYLQDMISEAQRFWANEIFGNN